MLWRLAVAAVSLVGFLGGATLVSTQLEKDVAAGFGLPGGLGSLDPGAPPGNVKPFRFDGISLPPNLPVQIPEGAIVNPDGSITLPDGAKLPLDGATFSNVDITLPTDGALKLPDDATFDGSKITCPSGCTLNIPGVGDYTLPPGSDLALPPDLARQLREQGYSGSNLPDSLRIPSGSDLTIPQLKASGDFTAQGGTRLVPPPGSSFGLPPGTVRNPTSINLPPGTDLDQTSALALLAGVGYLAATQAGYTPTELPPPLSEQGNGTAQAVEVYAQAEGAVRKGSPFYVAGFVRSLQGQGLPGAAVTIYVNQSVSSPGSAIGEAVTGADGTFRVQVTIPSSLPAGQYVVMAQSQPIRVQDVLYAGGWG